MPSYEFAVELTVGDNTAFTVRGALRALGYDELERVERADILRLHVADDGLSVDEIGAALTRAEVLFNPNKHRLVRAALPATSLHEAVVSDVDDDASALAELLRERFGISGLERIERATAWRLYEQAGAAGAERLTWACRTLLANAYSQTFVVRSSPTRTLVKVAAGK